MISVAGSGNCGREKHSPGPWQGKTLARTVAWISVLISLGIYLFANSLGPDARPDSQDARERDEAG